MMLGPNFLLFICVSIRLVNCQRNNGSVVATQLQWSIFNSDDQCPLWHIFNATTKLCECNITSSINDIVKCTEQGINLRVGHCMTYDEQEEGDSVIYIAHCNYFSGEFRTDKNGRYIEL